MTVVPTPRVGSEQQWVAEYLAGLAHDAVRASSMRGGQSAADAALDAYSVRGYSARRSEVWPLERRGASRLSPYIRHGLLQLPRVWRAVADGPSGDVERFRDELLWQEYTRHVYARLGVATRRSLRFGAPEQSAQVPAPAGVWPADMACLDLARGELESDGWVPNQVRMWMASQWVVRDGHGWRDGEDEFFRHLLDGSRAANRVGWQWTAGALTGKPYGFSRWQVDKRAPGLCSTCAHRRACPIEQWPDAGEVPARGVTDPRLRRDPDVAATSGPERTEPGSGVDGPAAVWITAESLGDDDPALAAHPDLPAVFVWDRPLLARLQLSAKRLVFLAECLADLALRREVVVHVGDPVEELAGMPVATTFAPVPGWRTRAAQIQPVEVHPWPWLVPPHDGPVTSFTAWRRKARV
jgi:deoxyribodipyrimidine photo-lyase